MTSSKNELIRINLNATTDSDIVWRAEQEKAQEIVKTQGRILWEFEFGFTTGKGFRLQDTLQWNTHRFAVEHYTNSIWPKYKQITCGISLFQGNLDWIRHLYWDEAQKEHFESWKSASTIPEALSYNLQSSLFNNQNRDIISLYAIEQLSDYLHRLNAYLPEESVRFVSFDVEESLSIWRIAQALSKERFPYILTDTLDPATSSLYAEMQERASTAICLPTDTRLTPEIGKLWESLYIALKKKSISFRVISEIFIAEDWADLEEIIVLTDSLSEFGRRQLEGFSISGGKIIFYGKSLDLPNSLHWNEWLR